MKKIIITPCLILFFFYVHTLSFAADHIASPKTTQTEKSNFSEKKSKIKVYQVTGEITAIDIKTKTINIKSKHGEVLLLIDDKTVLPIEWGNKPLTDINVGTMIIVRYAIENDKNIAKLIKFAIEKNKTIFEPTISIKPESSYAKQFFIDCDNAFKFKEFSALIDFFNRQPNELKPDSCFRLNNNEFLVIITDAATVYQGLHYINTKEDKMEKEIGGRMGVVQEFLGKNKKRYVLLAWGSYGTYGYSILHLIPKSNGKSYTEYNLIDVSEDPVSGFCGERREYFIKEDKNAADITSHKIFNESTEDVTIVFYITEENCKTLQKTNYTKKFKLIEGNLSIGKLIQQYSKNQYTGKFVKYWKP